MHFELLFFSAGRRLGQNGHRTIDLHRIAGNHFDRKMFGDFAGNGSFSGSGGSNNDQKRWKRYLLNGNTLAVTEVSLYNGHTG